MAPIVVANGNGAGYSGDLLYGGFEEMPSTTEADFRAFVNSIPNVEKRGSCSLRECIADSAITNASDTVHVEKAAPESELWDIALSTARLIADDWQSYYPELAQ
jgi:hypothetical protein